MLITEYENYHETKSHSTLDFPYNTYICTIPLDFEKVALHWHDEVEIIYIKKGCGQVNLDLNSYSVKAGDIVIVSPGQLHAISADINLSDDSLESSFSKTMEYENIIFSLELLRSRSMDALNQEFFEPFLAGTIAFDHLICNTHHLYPMLSSCLNRADDVCSSRPKGYRLAIKAYLFEFFYTIFTNSKDIPISKDEPHLERTKAVLKYVENHYDKTIRINEIADIAGFSPSHFMRFFKNVMGVSFTSYLSDYRLSLSARLLLSTNDSIIDIALSCGYENLSYFNRSFKKKYKKTPGEYRRGVL